MYGALGETPTEARARLEAQAAADEVGAASKALALWTGRPVALREIQTTAPRIPAWQLLLALAAIGWLLAGSTRGRGQW